MYKQTKKKRSISFSDCPIDRKTIKRYKEIINISKYTPDYQEIPPNFFISTFPVIRDLEETFQPMTRFCIQTTNHFSATYLGLLEMLGVSFIDRCLSAIYRVIGHLPCLPAQRTPTGGVEVWGGLEGRGSGRLHAMRYGEEETGEERPMGNLFATSRTFGEYSFEQPAIVNVLQSCGI